MKSKKNESFTAAYEKGRRDLERAVSHSSHSSFWCGTLSLMTDDAITRLRETRRKSMEERARADSDIAAIDRVLSLLGVHNDELQDSGTKTNEISESLSVARESAPSALQSAPSALQRIEKPASPNNRAKKLRITQEIRAAVQGFQGEFTQHDVVEWIKDKYPSAQVRSATVSSALWRMAKQGVIERVREGYGSEPNTYRRVSDDSPAQEGFPNQEPVSNEEVTVREKSFMSE